MATFVFPDSAELRMIDRDLLPRMLADRPWSSFFPVEESDDYWLMWEQLDNYFGLQQARGLGGAPQRIKRLGSKRYTMEPGVYGEFSAIDEVELTRRRPPGTFGGPPIDITDLVVPEQERLMGRELDRIELIVWTLLTTGTFSVSTPQNTVVHTDSYTTQTFTATVGWGTTATAHPLADLRAIKLLARGHSVRFDSSATLYVNSGTANNIYANGNATDLYGRRTAGLGTYNSPGQINQLLLGDNLPSITEYDAGYLDDSGTFQLFIPDNKGVLVGTRPNNTPVGAYRMTRNVNNPDLAPGSYSRVMDRGDEMVPRMIEVHKGHNGGPVIYYPSAIVLLNV